MTPRQSITLLEWSTFVTRNSSFIFKYWHFGLSLEYPIGNENLIVLPDAISLVGLNEIRKELPSPILELEPFSTITLKSDKRTKKVKI